MDITKYDKLKARARTAKEKGEKLEVDPDELLELIKSRNSYLNDWYSLTNAYHDLRETTVPFELVEKALNQRDDLKERLESEGVG